MKLNYFIDSNKSIIFIVILAMMTYFQGSFMITYAHK
jgi:hypothetical protein